MLIFRTVLRSCVLCHDLSGFRLTFFLVNQTSHRSTPSLCCFLVLFVFVSEPARATGRLSDARRAEQYLSFVRDTVGPTREDFRALVAGIHDTKRSSSADAVHGMKRFDARPKYVLRKLAFSVVPSTPAERVDFIRNRLGLDKSVPTEQRLCTKRDAFDILSAVCDHAPEYAQIPEVLRCR